MEKIETKEADTSPTNSKAEANASEHNGIDIAIEALHQLNQGKRHLLVDDFSSAVASLQESCQLFDQRFGIGAEECGEAYLFYGTALLELARLEDGLFDVAELSGEEETEDEEEEEDESQEESQEESQDETENKDKGEKKTDTEEDIGESDEEKKKRTNDIEKKEVEPCAQTSAASENAMDCQPSTSKSEANEESVEDDASNIEVSWEVLCLAKNVFSRHIDKNDNKLKLAETLQKLGEISIEWENNVNAIDLLTKCLNLRKEILPEDDRLIAETYYHLGIAFSFNNSVDNANNCFHSAVEVIERRISNQKQKLSTISTDDIEATETIKREVNRLESLLPEMKVKIEDQKEQFINVKEALERQQNEEKEEEAISSKNKDIKDKPISDISHLIKRKRQNSGSESSPKKLCSNGVNVVDNGKPEENQASDG